MKRVVVLGGGVSGLATADAIAREPGFDVTVIEKSARLGGNVATESVDGFTIDPGPDSWVATKPHASALAKSLGLEARLIGTKPENRRVYIALGKDLHAMPEGMILGIPTEVMPIVRSDLFTWDAKLRMALEPIVPPRRWDDPDDDESIGDFLARRLGDEMADRMAGPLLSGIFAGDAREISVRAAFPQLVDAETKHGSLVKAMRELRAMRRAREASGEEAGTTASSAFVSLAGGMGELVKALGDRVASRARVETGVGARSIARVEAERGYRVMLDDDRVIEADDVVLALPLPTAARVAATFDAPLADALGVFRVATTAVVFLAFRRDDVAHPLDATGYLVPRSLGKAALAATFVSSKWAHRAPDGFALIRLFFGGATHTAIASHDDDDLVSLACAELASFIPTRGAPVSSRVFRFIDASPQPYVGHLSRVKRVKDRLASLAGVHVAGNGFEGSGIPDCVKYAEAVARAIVTRARNA